MLNQQNTQQTGGAVYGFGMGSQQTQPVQPVQPAQPIAQPIVQPQTVDQGAMQPMQPGIAFMPQAQQAAYQTPMPAFQPQQPGMPYPVAQPQQPGFMPTAQPGAYFPAMQPGMMHPAMQPGMMNPAMMPVAQPYAVQQAQQPQQPGNVPVAQAPQQPQQAQVTTSAPAQNGEPAADVDALQRRIGGIEAQMRAAVANGGMFSSSPQQPQQPGEYAPFPSMTAPDAGYTRLADLDFRPITKE